MRVGKPKVLPFMLMLTALLVAGEPARADALDFKTSDNPKICQGPCLDTYKTCKGTC